MQPGTEIMPPGQQPLERAEYEASELGQKREAKALRYWAKHLTGMPACMIERVRGDKPPTSSGS